MTKKHTPPDDLPPASPSGDAPIASPPPETLPPLITPPNEGPAPGDVPAVAEVIDPPMMTGAELAATGKVICIGLVRDRRGRVTPGEVRRFVDAPGRPFRIANGGRTFERSGDEDGIPVYREAEF